MGTIRVVYFSGYGHTARLAAAVLDGITSVGAAAAGIVVDAEGNLPETAWTELREADTIVFGCPTYMGCIPWQYKRFIDASSQVWAAQGWRDKLAAGFTNSGSMNGDKHMTLSYLFQLAMQHAMLWVGPGLMPANKVLSQRDDINYLGAFHGLMAQSPADAGADLAPGTGDLETARLFGQRVARASLRWQSGDIA